MPRMATVLLVSALGVACSTRSRLRTTLARLRYSLGWACCEGTEMPRNGSPSSRCQGSMSIDKPDVALVERVVDEPLHLVDFLRLGLGDGERALHAHHVRADVRMPDQTGDVRPHRAAIRDAGNTRARRSREARCRFRPATSTARRAAGFRRGRTDRAGPSSCPAPPTASSCPSRPWSRRAAPTPRARAWPRSRRRNACGCRACRASPSSPWRRFRAGPVAAAADRRLALCHPEWPRRPSPPANRRRQRPGRRAITTSQLGAVEESTDEDMK